MNAFGFRNAQSKRKHIGHRNNALRGKLISRIYLARIQAQGSHRPVRFDTCWWQRAFRWS